MAASRRCATRPWWTSSGSICPPAELDDRAPLQRAPGSHDSGMGDMLRYDVERLRILVERHLLYTGSARAREILETGTARCTLHQGDAEGLPARPARAGRPNGKPPPRSPPNSHSGVNDDGQAHRLPRNRASRPHLRQARGAAEDVAASSSTRCPPASGSSRCARCMDCGIPFCHYGLPGQQPDPGLERPRLQGRVARGAGHAPLRPTTSRSSPAASAPRPARRPAR